MHETVLFVPFRRSIPFRILYRPSTQRRSATIKVVIKCTQCWSFLFIAAHYIGALRSQRIPLIRAASML